MHDYRIYMHTNAHAVHTLDTDILAFQTHCHSTTTVHFH